jgi:hypothetical protein
MWFSAVFQVSSHLMIPRAAYQYMEFVLEGSFTERQKKTFCFWCGSVIAFLCSYVSPCFLMRPVATRSDNLICMKHLRSLQAGLDKTRIESQESLWLCHRSSTCCSSSFLSAILWLSSSLVLYECPLGVVDHVPSQLASFLFGKRMSDQRGILFSIEGIESVEIFSSLLCQPDDKRVSTWVP